jgi:hypothetical protein
VASELTGDLTVLVDVDVVAHDRGLGPRDGLLRDGGLAQPALPRPELQQLVLGLDPQRLLGAADGRHPGVVARRRPDDDRQPEVEQLVRRLGPALLEDDLRGMGSPRSAARAANKALSSIAVLHRRDERGIRHDEAEALGASRSRCCETKTIDWSEQYMRTGGRACRRANSTSRSARASSCRSAGCIQSQVMTLRA